MNADSVWYGSRHWLSLVLWPLSGLFCAAVRLRRTAYQRGWLTVYRSPVPVIVVGNVTVGGSGKTPLVIWLARFLQSHGFRPGVVSRGYGGTTRNFPLPVQPDTDPVLAGDEPVLIAQRAGCPVAVSPRRTLGVQWLLAQGCDVIVADDGLQHYALGRTVEIAVVDGQRGFGNQRCLPAGPLREPLTRLRTVHFVVTKNAAAAGIPMTLQGDTLINLSNPAQTQPLRDLTGQTVHALAGIAYPDSFFKHLRASKLHVLPHPFPDHHRFCAADLVFADEFPILLTEKDAVKCQNFATPRCWVLPVSAQLPTDFGVAVLARIFHEPR